MRFLAELSVMRLPVLLESNTAAKMSNDSNLTGAFLTI